MPYIPETDRHQLEHRPPGVAGELNYLITRQVLDYIGRRGVSYATFNETVGVLECVKQELYRRVIGEYEDRKCSENGDVYPW